jgi:hypothetical protein
MTDDDLEVIAADFWAGTDFGEIFPRNIEQALALKLPVTVVKLSVVTVRTIGHWLRKHHRCPASPSYRRDLMGCLYADGGQGLIFVCGADTPEEQRFTIAHDAAHFLVDYWLPRLRVLAALGPSVAGVLDGRRRPQSKERAAAILEGVRLGPHWHLLPRRCVNPEEDARIGPVEDRADELGLELVAPRQRVRQLLNGIPDRRQFDAAAICNELGVIFGLPPYVFTEIAAVERRPRVPSFLEDVRRALGR